MSPKSKFGIFGLFLCLSITQLPVTSACGRGAIYILNNEYRQILIAISETVPENPALIDRIKDVFTEASAYLYQVTNSRAYFGNITILVPKTWSSSPEYEPLTNETFDNSDVVVDAPDPNQSNGNKPFVIKTTPCGDLGLYMHLTPDYLLEESIASEYGPYDKVLIHEWAHLRYGVFDEYPDEITGTHFYAASNGEMEATRCSKELTGRAYNRVTGGNCGVVNGMLEPDCRFEDDEVVNGDTYGSLMYRALSHVGVFCDDDDSNPLTLHNREAPTKQNQMCAGKSIWEVLREHGDFVNDNNPPRAVSSTVPHFRVVHSMVKRTVLVLDVSGSMGDSDRYIRQNQACSHFITTIVSDGEEIGIVEFSGSATSLLNMTVVDNNSRSDIVSSLPSGLFGSTSIGSGVTKALEVLEAGGGTAGGTIIIVSDGKENFPPYITDVWDTVMSSGVTVHSIAFTWMADSNMDALAQATGGLAFLYSDLDTSNALNDAFQTIGELNISPLEQSYTLSSQGWDLATRGTVAGSVVVDSTLGRDTEFLFDHGALEGITVTLTSPSGNTYDLTSPECTENTMYRIIVCFFPGQTEIGRWDYEVTSQIDANQRLAITIKSKSSSSTDYPIIAQAYWGLRELDLNAASNEQRLFASVSKGYAAVLGADVIAEVETPSGTVVNLTLLDNGAGADLTSNDGVYSSYFLNFVGDGRYNVKVLVNSNAATVVEPQIVVGSSGASLITPSPLTQDATFSGDFQRQSTGGSFETINYVADVVVYPPGGIHDLKVTSVNRDEKKITLAWTAQGAQLDVGRASIYEIRRSSSYSLDSDYDIISQDYVISGGNITSPLPSGGSEIFLIQLPEQDDVTYFFAVLARDLDGRDAYSEISNIVSSTMRPVDLEQSIYAVKTAVVTIFGIISLLGVLAVKVFLHSHCREHKKHPSCC